MSRRLALVLTGSVFVLAIWRSASQIGTLLAFLVWGGALGLLMALAGATATRLYRRGVAGAILGGMLMIGAMVVPTLVLGLLLDMPWRRTGP